MKLSGWGNYPVIDAEVVSPRSAAEATALLRDAAGFAGIAGKDTREAAEVPGDRLCEFPVGGCCQVEFTASPGLVAQVFQEPGMVRQDFDVDIDARRNLLLEPGTAPQQPERDQQEIKRIVF
jgi:hypothetical protein